MGDRARANWIEKWGRAVSVVPLSSVGRIKMKLGIQVGLSPGHIVLGGDRAPPPPKGHSPQFSAHVYYSYYDFVRTLQALCNLSVCSSSSSSSCFSILCILFLDSLNVISLFRYAQLHHIAEVGVPN